MLAPKFFHHRKDSFTILHLSLFLFRIHSAISYRETAEKQADSSRGPILHAHSAQNFLKRYGPIKSRKDAENLMGLDLGELGEAVPVSLCFNGFFLVSLQVFVIVRSSFVVQIKKENRHVSLVPSHSPAFRIRWRKWVRPRTDLLTKHRLVHLVSLFRHEPM
jgi:hypothetical protein